MTGLSKQQIALLDNMKEEMGYHGDWCFYVIPEQDVNIYDGYIPSMVFRGVQSYFNMNGPVYSDIPFIIGKTLAEAQANCKLMNQHIQLSDDIVEQIVESAGIQKD